MSRSDERRLRSELKRGLDANAERLREAFRGVVADPFPVPEGRPLHFEIDPDSFRLTVGETDLLPGWWLHQELPRAWFDHVEETGQIPAMVVADALLPWLSEQWDDVGGRWTHSPAYAFWSGFEVRYDLESRRWLTVSQFLGGVKDF